MKCQWCGQEIETELLPLVIEVYDLNESPESFHPKCYVLYQLKKSDFNSDFMERVHDALSQAANKYGYVWNKGD